LVTAPIKSGTSPEIVAAQDPVLVPQGLDRLNQVDRIDVVDPHGTRMVAQALMVAGQAQDVANAERGGPQEIALQGEAIAVAHHHLQHGLRAGLLEQETAGEARHAHDGGLIVGHVDGVARRCQQRSLSCAGRPADIPWARRPRWSPRTDRSPELFLDDFLTSLRVSCCHLFNLSDRRGRWNAEEPDGKPCASSKERCRASAGTCLASQ
jgi:hypothetical protein